MEEAHKNWTRMRFRKNKVWVATDAEGIPVTREGKVLVKYQPGQPYQYWVRAESIHPLEPLRKKGAPHEPETAGGGGRPDAIFIYTHGASSANPGPSGIGVRLCYGSHEKEISRHIGEGTGTIAELEAIRVGLAQVKNRNLPVRLFTDSGNAYGLLAQGRPARQQAGRVAEILRLTVAEILRLAARFRDLKWIRVESHAGDPGNERARRLAAAAITNRR